MKDASSDTRNNTSVATSSELPRRSIGCRETSPSCVSWGIPAMVTSVKTSKGPPVPSLLNAGRRAPQVFTAASTASFTSGARHDA